MKFLRFLLVFTSLIFLSNYVHAQQCPGAHCSKKSAKINAICKKQGKQGEPVWVEHGSDFCYCTCSCLAAFTPVMIDKSSSKLMGEIKVGENVLAFNYKGAWKTQEVEFSDGTSMPDEPMPYVIMVTFSDDTQIIATPDHLFLSPKNTLIRADRLTPLDKVKATNGTALGVAEVTHGAYQGAIHNLAINWGEKDIERHLIGTNGVVSADYYIQSRQDEYKIEKNRIQVGSQAYTKKFPSRSLSSVPNTISTGENSFFTPYKEFDYPEDAVHLIPDGYYEPDESLISPLDNTVPYSMAKSIINYYKVHYPNVNYIIDWGNNQVNAVAFRRGNARYVSLYGGLLRHRHIQAEGVGLVLAHELGHHFGGKPRYTGNSWASCEGQSDYWGAAVAQRKVWFGKYYFDQTSKGSDQLYNFFSRAPFVEFMQSQKALGICSHPAATCRRDTYQAAMRLDDKPSCAGDPSEFLFPPDMK